MFILRLFAISFSYLRLVLTMQSSLPPTGSAMPPLLQKKRRLPWVLAGCGCLSLIGLGCGALVLAYLWGYLGKQAPKSARSPAAVPPTSAALQQQSNTAISASDLSRAYEDEAAGDKLYKGKRLTVNGRVYFAGVPMYQKIVMVSLKDNEGKDRVVCNFPVSAKDTVAALREDQSVTIRGRCDGAAYHIVQLKDCELVPDQAPRSNTTTTKPGPSAAPQEEELIRFKPYIVMAAKVWLQSLDTGDYRGSYGTAGPSFRRGTTVEQWHKALSQMRQVFGTVKSRDPNAIITRSDSTSNGVTTSTYLVQIHTTFTKRNGTETVTVIPESGDFKVSDYTIEAPR